MDWLQNKTTQIIALVGIVSTLGGFGYQGAELINRISNLEAKIGGIGDTENAQKIIEERFASCLLYTSPSPRDRTRSRMPSSA